MLCLVLLILAGIGIFFSVSEDLETTFYHLYSSKIQQGVTVRAVVLADLHNKEFGEGNQELVDKIRALKPDLIVMAGDMVNREEEDTSVVLELCRKLKEIAPIYYGLGNNEGTMIYENGIPLDEMLREEGVQVLINDAVEAEVRGNAFLIGSIATGNEGYELYAADFMDWYEKSGDFKLLITHVPELYYEPLKDAEIDLGIGGHYHGGQIRLPFLGGLYSIEYGFFPKYCDGMFELENGTLFVSRGLGNHHKIPRINNRPELAVIDINQRK